MPPDPQSCPPCRCRQLFAMPNRALGEGLFYSFDLGPLHIMAYNTGGWVQ